MKRASFLTAIFCLSMLILVALFGCKSNGGGQDIEIRLAPIHEVKVNIAESYPPQVIVYIKGGLSDNCTTFHELTQQRNGNTITIEVTTKRPKKEVCAQVYGFFERNVNLGTDFTSGETYAIKVNDKTETFVMQ
jgi:hypothetical protein